MCRAIPEYARTIERAASLAVRIADIAGANPDSPLAAAIYRDVLPLIQHEPGADSAVPVFTDGAR